MTVFINNEPVKLDSSFVTLAELIKQKGISTQGLAIAINDILIKRDAWPTTKLSDMDRIMLIKAAYGG